jgi:RNA polymerase sigma-70 factor (ECF subfamily)
VEQIVRRYQQPVIRLIARIVGDPAQAEDLAQDTFIKAFRNLAAFDPTRRLSSWLFRIAHNTAIDAVRRARPAVVPLDALPPDGAGVPAAPTGADPVEQAALGGALTLALARVRPEYRAAITLRYEEDLSFEAIGQILNIPTATARSHVHRARKELLRHLVEAGWQPPARPQRP